jgi:serine protease Do
MLQLIALVVVAAFTVSAAGSWLRLPAWPSAGVVIESWLLSREPVVREARRAVVGVEVVTGSAGKRRGTGFNLHPGGVVVTNRHIVEDAVSVTISFPGLGRFPAREWVCAAEADLAAIYLDGQDLPFVPLHSGPSPQRGDTVTVIGNPLDFSRLVMRGPVSELRRLRGIPDAALEIDVPIRPGHSGSPVFNGAGEVVAVIFASVESGEPPAKRGLALPVSLLRLLGETQ